MCGSFRDTWQNGMFYRQQIAYKLTTDFEYRTKRQSEIKECVFLDVDSFSENAIFEKIVKFCLFKTNLGVFQSGAPSCSQAHNEHVKIWFKKIVS